MMHQRPPSARTGGAAKLLTPQEFTRSVGEWMAVGSFCEDQM